MTIGHQRDLDDFARLNMLGDSRVFQDTLRSIDRIASVDATVLILGETGTGKELAARALHYLSRRRDFPFVPINCGALPDSLLESELFGHERGAFTDAKHAARGIVSEAVGGTLFFDEVEAMSPRAQVVLLRFLQDRKYRPVGGRILISGDVRIVASSNVDLEELVRQNQFRRDLLFRFKVLSVTMPPLRERGNDVVLLAENFLQRYAVQYERPEKEIHPDTIDWLLAHRWPGNVRELEHLILREYLLTDSHTIRIGKANRATSSDETKVPYFGEPFGSAKARAVAGFEKEYLCHLLEKTRGNVAMAARIAQKDRSALNKLVKKHALDCRLFRTMVRVSNAGRDR